LQSKLLRVLQEGEFERIGSARTIKVDVRIIAATNRNLEEQIKKNLFRKDLYYRLNVYPVTIAPLRDRSYDIPLLVEHFVKRFNNKIGKKITRISKKTIKQLQSYSWPGNVRELENTMERAVLICNQDVIAPHHLMLDGSCEHGGDREPFTAKTGWTVREMEKSLIFHTLEEVEDNRTRAAELLGISVRTLRNKLREYKEELGEVK